MPNLEKTLEAQLTNTERFYLERAEEVSVLAKAGQHEECYRLRRQWLTYADLPLFFRGSFLLILVSSGTNDERIIYAEEALGHFNRLCDEYPKETNIISFRYHAQSVLNKAIALKALHDKEEADRSNERTDEELASWLLERVAIESGQRTPEDSLREVKLALATGQFPGMGMDVDSNGDETIRVKTLKPEERAAIQKGRFASPRPIGSAKLRQYGKQKPRKSILDKKWLQLQEADMANELAKNTAKARQEALDKLAEGTGASYVYEGEDGKMEEMPLPQYGIKDEDTILSRKRNEQSKTFPRELAAKLSGLGELLGLWGSEGDIEGKGLPTPEMSMREDASEKMQTSKASSVVQTPIQFGTPQSPRTPVHHQDQDTPLSRTPLTYRRKPSEGNLKKRLADDEEDEEDIGTAIKRVKSKG